MGKRAAAKPKAPAKRARGTAAAAAASADPPLPPAPGYWARPAVPEAEAVTSQALRVFVVDVEDGPPPAAASGSDGKDAAHELRLYGLTATGCSVCMRLQGVRPYFYARCSADARGHEGALRTALDSLLPAALRGSGVGVVSVEAVRRTPVLNFQPEEDMLKVTVAGPRLLQPCVRALEQGVRLLGAGAGGAAVEVQALATYEANIPLILRFLVDKDIGGGRWLELPAGAFRLVPPEVEGDEVAVAAAAEGRSTSGEPDGGSAPGGAAPSEIARASTAQLEVVAEAAAAQAVHLDDEGGSLVPPVRIVSLQVHADAEGKFSAAALALAVEGERCPIARAVWLLRLEHELLGDTSSKAAGEWDEVMVEEYDPSKAEAPKAFVSNHEQSMLEHLGKTLEALDADIVLAYDLPQCVRGLLGLGGVAKSGSALARGLARRLGTEVKLTAKSNEVTGFIGRLAFDLQKQVEKEHRLVDYSLGALAEHFCKRPLPELREAQLTRLRSQRPRAFAQQLLRQAEACLAIFDQLAFLYNFVEMARVTSCPLSYLLERGQAVKVQAQLLREAGRRGFVLPSQRPSTGEDAGYEGATVLEPASGFYRCPIAVLDFASLYPSIMLAHNLCYSTMLPGGAEQHPDAPAHAVAPADPRATEGLSDRRCCFVEASVRRGLLPSILEQLLAARRSARKQLAQCGKDEDLRRKVLHGRQLALKLSANSVYGFTGAMNGPLPCLELAGAVTAYGRAMIQATKAKVEEHFSRSRGYEGDAQVVYGDTDSVMVHFGPDDLTMERAMELSREASEVCTASFPSPVKLEFEKIYRPFLLMNKKRYAGLAWTSPSDEPKLETKGIETVRRDWSDLVRHGLERALQLLLRPDGADGTSEATTFVRGLVDELRQNKVDFRSLVISKSLGREEYKSQTPHSALAEKLRKRDPATAPVVGDRVSYLVLAGAAKSKVFERVEDPLYALEHELPVDAEYYLESQLKQPLIRVFEHVYGDPQKAEKELFGVASGQKMIVAAASASSAHGLGKFMKPRPKCLACGTAAAANDKAAFCSTCEGLGGERHGEVRQALLLIARRCREQLADLRAHCAERCSLPEGPFAELPADAAATVPAVAGGAVPSREECPNCNCQVIFRRARCAKELRSSTEGLVRLGITDW